MRYKSNINYKYFIISSLFIFLIKNGKSWINIEDVFNGSFVSLNVLTHIFGSSFENSLNCHIFEEYFSINSSLY